MKRYIKSSAGDLPFYLDREPPEGTNKYLYEEFHHLNGSTYVQQKDLIEAIAYTYDESYGVAKAELKAGEYSYNEVQNALDYYNKSAF